MIWGLLVYTSMYIFIVWVSLAITIGVFYLSEIAEEQPTVFGIAIKYSVMTVATLHVLLLFESTLPRSYVLIGLVTHGSYYSLLKDFPVVQGSTNPWLISSIVLFVIDNVAWIWHLNSYYYSTMEIMCFGQIFLWLVPFLYLVSLSVNDNVLPGISASQPTATTSTSLRSLFSHFGFGRGADKRTDLPTAASAAQNLPQSAAMRRSRSAGSFASVRHRAAPFPNAGSQNPARLNMDARGSGPSGL